MYSLVLMAHTLLALSIIVLVLLQQGRGGAGALGGGVSSDSFFGSRGSFGLLMKVTATFTALFFVTSLGLAFLAKRQLGSDISPGIIREQIQQQQEIDQGTQLPSFEGQENQQQQEIDQGNQLPSFEEQENQPQSPQ